MKHMGGLSDITSGRTVRGANGIGARIWHLVISPKGSIPQDPTLGWGLPLKLGTKVTETSLRTEAAYGRDAIKADPEVQDATVTITEVSTGIYRVSITVVATDGAVIEIEEELRGLS